MAGGIKSTNMLRTLHSCVSPAGHFCDGVAVVSDIMASPERQAAGRSLAQTYRAWEVATPGECFISSLLTLKAIAIAAAELVDTVLVVLNTGVGMCPPSRLMLCDACV